MFAQISHRPVAPGLPVRPFIAATTAFAGLALFSLGFAAVALGSLRARLDPAQVADADRLHAAAPVIVVVGILHFVAALGLLDGPRAAAVIGRFVGLVGSAATAGVLAELTIAGDPARLGGHSPASGLGILAIAFALYAALAVGAAAGHEARDSAAHVA
jgi:hypothetical protein